MDNAEREIQEISNREYRSKTYLTTIRKNFKKNPQETIDDIRDSKWDSENDYHYGVRGVVDFFQNLRKTTKTDLDFVGNYLADNADILEKFTKVNASTNILPKEHKQGVELLDKKTTLKLYLDNYLKTFNFPHDVEKITKLVAAFSKNYYKHLNLKGEKQTLEEIYQKTFNVPLRG